MMVVTENCEFIRGIGYVTKLTLEAYSDITGETTVTTVWRDGELRDAALGRLYTRYATAIIVNIVSSN